MGDDLDTHGRLTNISALLYGRLGSLQHTTDIKVAELDLLIHDARAREYRRAQFNARDRDAYRLGGAFEPCGGLILDGVQLTGFLALGTTGILLLAKEALAHPTLSIVDLLGRLFLSRSGRIIRTHGVYVRWQWLAKLYFEETEGFQNSRKGRDPKQRWRREKPTSDQTYLIVQICRLLQIERPTLPDRGAAYDWIKSQGGNPRFAGGPPTIDLAELKATVG